MSAVWCRKNTLQLLSWEIDDVSAAAQFVPSLRQALYSSALDLIAARQRVL
jgi:hypothetical protein